MKKFLVISIIFFLAIATAITKNSTKKVDIQLSNLKEDLIILNNKYELVLLDFNFLSSPKKLLEYQESYFENDLVPSDIINFKKVYFNKKQIVIEEIVELENNNEEKWK